MSSYTVSSRQPTILPSGMYRSMGPNRVPAAAPDRVVPAAAPVLPKPKTVVMSDNLHQIRSPRTLSPNARKASPVRRRSSPVSRKS